MGLDRRHSDRRHGVIPCVCRGLLMAELLFAAWPASAEVPAAAAATPAVLPSGPRSLLVPAGVDQGVLAVELAAEGLWLNACANSHCTAQSGHKLELPPAARAALGNAQLSVLELAPGHRLVHVQIPLAEGAWEALLAAAIGRLEPLVIFSGLTGAVEGDDGQRQGDAIWIREEDKKGLRILVGRLRDDVQLCGRPTLVEPRLLGEDLSLRPAKVQQLSVEERRGARVLSARRAEHGPTPGGNALRALAASSAVGAPSALTDGRNDTSWAEARGGEGRGEFVVLRPFSGAGLIGLEFLVRPDGAVSETGAAPRTLWLATRTQLFRVDWDEDAWKTPGVWYRVQFPEPVNDDCVALVLEKSFAERPDTQVTLAEVRGVSELQALDPKELVGRLSTPGDVGAAAVPALLQAGPVGVEAVVGAFGALDATGRARALDVIENAPCELTAQVYVELLSDDDPRTRRRAEQRLRACGTRAHAELRRAFEQSSGQAAGVALAQGLATIAPALAVELIGARLAAVAAEQRAGYREALSRAANFSEAEPGLRRLLGGSGLGVAAEMEVVRALGELLPKYQPDASRVFAKAAAAARTFPLRYLLLGPAARLAPKDPIAVAFFLQALGDSDPYLRGAAARTTPDLPPLHAPLLVALRDPEARVREASASRLGELGLMASAPTLIERLSGDAWPFVRVAAARSLALLGASPPIDTALAAALTDPSTEVRVLSLRALGRRGARQQIAAIRKRFQDPKEEAPVRAAAVRALGDLCDAALLDELTKSAWSMLADRPSPDDVSVGSAAVAALGRLAPADLERRLAPLAAKKDQPLLEHMLHAALHSTQRCTAPASSSSTPVR